MPNCDQLFLSLKSWASKQPNAIVDAKPTPTPEDTFLEDVLGGYFVLDGFDFPNQSFTQGGRLYGFAKTDDGAYFWILIDQDFDALTVPWYDNGLAKKDALLLEAMADQANGKYLHIMYDSPISPQQFRAIRQQSKQPVYGNSEDWEPSHSFSVLLRITTCRTLVPREDAEFGWTAEAVALYRQGVGLSLRDPTSDSVHFIGSEPADAPDFLLSEV